MPPVEGAVLAGPPAPVAVPGWRPVLAGAEAAAALAVAAEVGRRVLDPAVRGAASAAAAGQTGYPDTVRWDPVDVAQGDAGLALLAVALDAAEPDAGWDAAAHRSLATAAGAADGHWSARLFGGLAGLAFAADRASRGGVRYRRLAAGLDQAVADQVVPQAAALADRDGGVDVSDYDLISGVTGTAAYLLDRVARPGAGPEVPVALDAVLRALVRLTAPTAAAPRWHTPHHLLRDPNLADGFPGGVLNCGLAHGVPGPLAVLALAARAGVEVPGQRESIAATAGWLVRHRAEDRWGPGWPSVVATAPNGRVDLSRPRQPGRSAWCYGGPGVARALSLAAPVLGDPGLTDVAAETVLAALRRPPAHRNVDSPTFCHGLAGLTQIVLRLAADTGRADLAEAGAGLARQLLAGFDPATPLGYADLEPEGARVDQPGVLTGAAGVALVLLAAAGPAEPAWDRLFLLS